MSNRGKKTIKPTTSDLSIRFPRKFKCDGCGENHVSHFEAAFRQLVFRSWKKEGMDRSYARAARDSRGFARPAYPRGLHRLPRCSNSRSKDRAAGIFSRQLAATR